MRIEYNIFHLPGPHYSRVEFKIFLQTEDYILLNQYPDLDYSSTLIFESDLIESSKNLNLTDSPSGKRLTYKWGLDVITHIPVRNDDAVEEWETPEYSFVFHRVGDMPTAEDRIQEIKYQIIRKMQLIKKGSQDMGPCEFHKSEEIKY